MDKILDLGQVFVWKITEYLGTHKMNAINENSINSLPVTCDQHICATVIEELSSVNEYKTRVVSAQTGILEPT